MGNVKVRLLRHSESAKGGRRIGACRAEKNGDREWRVESRRRMSPVPSLRPENPVAGIAETGKDVAVFVELAV